MGRRKESTRRSRRTRWRRDPRKVWGDKTTRGCAEKANQILKKEKKQRTTRAERIREQERERDQEQTGEDSRWKRSRRAFMKWTTKRKRAKKASM